MNKPGKVQTFDSYSREGMMTAVEKEITRHKTKVTHIVFDRYLNSSLKNHSRSARGKGIRRKVTATTYTPKSWELFLGDADNKT